MIFDKEDHEQRTIVRLVTTYFQTERGASFRKELKVLKRLSSGFNEVEEHCNNSGPDIFIESIINFHLVPDGIYELKMVNNHTNWETGIVDDWDYKLVEYVGENHES